MHTAHVTARSVFWSFVATASLIGTAAATETTLINGSFETGDYTGWTLSEDSGFPTNGTWGIAATGLTIDLGESTFDFFDGVLVQQNSPGLPITYTPTDGGFMAYQLQNGPEIHRMYQDVSLPANAQSLTWDMFYTNHEEDFSTDTQFLAINIRNLSDIVLATLFKTGEDDPPSIPMTSFSGDISAFAGQTVRIEVAQLQALDNVFDAGFDNFAVAVTPEPDTALLLASGLVAMALRSRRRVIR